MTLFGFTASMLIFTGIGFIVGVWWMRGLVEHMQELRDDIQTRLIEDKHQLEKMQELARKMRRSLEESRD